MASRDGSVPKRPLRNNNNKRSHASAFTAVTQQPTWDATDDDDLSAPPPPRKKPRPPPAVDTDDVGAPLRSSGGGGCLVCGLDNDHENVLLCEACNGEYHTYCLQPPLTTVPEHEWFCEKCRSATVVDDSLDAMVASLPASYTERFGQVLWAQGGVGYGWWPAIVYDPRLTVGTARLQALKHLGRKYLVYFFECDEAPFELLPEFKMMYWEQGLLEDCHLGKTAKAHSKHRLQEFRSAVHAATLEETKPKPKRLDWHQPEQQQGASPLIAVTASTSPRPGRRGGGRRSDTKPRGRPGRPPKKPVPPPAHPDSPPTVPRKTRQRGRTSTGGGAGEDHSSTSSMPPPGVAATGAGGGADPMMLEAHHHHDTMEASAAVLSSSSGNVMYCTILRQDGTRGATPLGFVALPVERSGPTFGHLRQVICSDLVPDAMRADWDWRFWVPNLGPLSRKQEDKFGPLLPFLCQAAGGTEVIGNGTLRQPVHVTLVEAPRPV